MRGVNMTVDYCYLHPGPTRVGSSRAEAKPNGLKAALEAFGRCVLRYRVKQVAASTMVCRLSPAPSYNQPSSNPFALSFLHPTVTYPPSNTISLYSNTEAAYVLGTHLILARFLRHFSTDRCITPRGSYHQRFLTILLHHSLRKVCIKARK